MSQYTWAKNWYIYLGKLMLSTNIGHCKNQDPTILLLSIYPRELKTCSPEDVQNIAVLLLINKY